MLVLLVYFSLPPPHLNLSALPKMRCNHDADRIQTARMNINTEGKCKGTIIIRTENPDADCISIPSVNEVFMSQLGMMPGGEAFLVWHTVLCGPQKLNLITIENLFKESRSLCNEIIET